jgi:protocatechuate 3,4-dioxygenase beta subunit
MTPTRRSFCELGSAALLAGLVGCGDDAPSGTADSGGTGSGESGPGSSTGGAETSGALEASGSTDGSGSSSSAADTSDGSSTSSESSTDSGTTGAELCEASPGSIEGPFYRPGIPIRSNLDLYGDVGVPVRLRGRVTDGDCLPVVGAIVELWHASPAAPDRVPGDIDASYDATVEYRYYGQVATDARGGYAFDTLRPGWYLNGAAYRPAHLHVKIWADDVERLTTQLYFEADPFNDGDPWFDPTMVLVLADDGSVERDFAI